jgi:hypothetical protein
MDSGKICQLPLLTHLMFIVTNLQNNLKQLKHSLKLIVNQKIKNYQKLLKNFNLNLIQFAHLLVAHNINFQMMEKNTHRITSYQTSELTTTLNTLKQVKHGHLKKLDTHGYGKKLRSQSQLNTKSNLLTLT